MNDPRASNDESRLLDTIGQLAGGIAHEFNNLLTAIQGYTDLLDDSSEGEAGKQAHLNEIRLATRRAAAVTRQLLAFSRKQFLAPRAVRTADVVAGITPMLTRLIGETIDLKTTASGRGVVMADEGQLEQVLVNLVVNARDAMPHGGSVAIETSDVVLDDSHAARHPGVPAGRYAMISVSDTGCGMDKETERRAFEPFFTTKSTGHGTGLGLATVYGIVKQSNGHISIVSEVGRGTTFKILLPVGAGTAYVDDPPAAARAPSKGGAERILIVEDEDMVREFVSRTLRRAGYSVIAASNPVDALAIADREPMAIDLLVTDIVLPDMKGPALANELRRRRPDCRVLYMSGYTADVIVRQGWHDGKMEFLQKPFSLETLRSRVREVLDRAAAWSTAPLLRGPLNP